MRSGSFITDPVQLNSVFEEPEFQGFLNRQWERLLSIQREIDQ